MLLTGNPTATLRSAILLVPARRLTGPLNVQLLSSFVPKAEPVKGNRNHLVLVELRLQTQEVKNYQVWLQT